MTGRTAVKATEFVLAVPDPRATADWWIKVMGFAETLVIDGWVFVARDACQIRLGACPDAIPVTDLGDHQYFGYVWIEDVDAYADEIRAKGAEIVSGPQDRDWGAREMPVRTPDGHRVMFASPVRAKEI